MSSSANIARHLSAMAVQQPDATALKIPRGRTKRGEIDYLSLSFAELETEVDTWVRLLIDHRIDPGARVLVMVRPGLPLIASAFALFKHGAIPIIADPGMGLKSFLACVSRSRPDALLGIPLARILSHIFRRSFQTVRARIPASGTATARLARKSAITPPIEARVCTSDALAAILFTSGSTGAPKGVCYEHGMFEAQVELIQRTYAIEPGEIDLPMLPIFALFNPALGMTTIVPEIDPSRPASVDPRKIVQAIQQESVTNSFGSPTLWNKIADHCIANHITLPSLRRVLCAGAPVPLALWEKSREFIPNGQLHSPYGATEALPVSSISAEEILRLTSESFSNSVRTQTEKTVSLPPHAPRGACVGRPIQEIRVKIIALHEGPLASLAEAHERASSEVGEIIVSGPVVTKAYDALPSATAEAKIDDPVSLWHRLGDCGFFDPEGNLWFCGRKAERVETSKGIFFTEPIEQIFRGEPNVARCALIGLGARPQQTPALVVQLADNSVSAEERQLLAQRLRSRALAQTYEPAQEIFRFFFHPSFPVDVRHNAKIHRLTLTQWAATQTPIEVKRDTL